jgi:hypothetical protein
MNYLTAAHFYSYSYTCAPIPPTAAANNNNNNNDNKKGEELKKLKKAPPTCIYFRPK